MTHFNDILNARKSSWDQLCTKYMKSNTTNDLDLPCSEIDENSFDISTASKTCKLEKAVVLKSKSHSCNYLVQTTKSTKDLKYLKSYVEIVLKSNLKDILHKRSESRILEDDEYDHWHQTAKKELRRLQKNISKFQLDCYMTYCINMFDKALVRDLINDMNTDLKKLLMKREHLRSDMKKFRKNNKKLYLEWKKLTEILPLEYIIFYASEVVAFIDPRKRGLTARQKITKENAQYASSLG